MTTTTGPLVIIETRWATYKGVIFYETPEYTGIHVDGTDAYCVIFRNDDIRDIVYPNLTLTEDK